MPDLAIDFQVYLIEWALRTGRAGLFEDCGMGKGQPHGSLVMTPNGWTAIEKLERGDFVVSSDGLPHKVTGIYPKQTQDTYRVYFSDGTSFVVDGDHLHIVRTNNDRQRGEDWRVLSTRQLLSCGNLRYGENGKSRNYDIPVVGPVAFPERELPIEPYLLGALLGDGCFRHSLQFSNTDDEILSEVKRLLPDGLILKKKSGKNCDWNITHATSKRGVANPLTDSLKRLALFELKSDEKFIPEEFLYSSVGQRLALLRGLMDTDGYAGDSAQFYSTSRKLADGVEFLVRSLGGIPTRSQKQTFYIKGETKKDCLPCEIVTFSLKTFNPFLLRRKAEKWNSSPRDNGRWIDRIEFEKEQPTVCISVDSPDSSYVTEHFIVTHNTMQELTWAENIVRQTNKNVLLLTPLAVSMQTVREGEKFGIECSRSLHGMVKKGITITNYEQLHRFSPDDFGGIVCDESSILKNYDGKRKSEITEFMKKIPYRLLGTATGAPNDYTELGTSSEALGYLGHIDMLNRFFRNQNNTTDTKGHWRGTGRETRNGAHLHEWEGKNWRFKGHAEIPFWRYTCSWSRAMRRPSDLGFSDERFILPPLTENEHVVPCESSLEGFLFPVNAVTLNEQRDERRRTIKERCEKVAELVAHDKPALVWCHLNEEGKMLRQMIPDAVEVSGSDSVEKKEERLLAFADNQTRVLITKPKIGGFGLNLQHCSHVTFFPSHSYEQYYQGVRRCWRFGQQNPVTVDIVTTEGERGVLKNLKRKAAAADRMFTNLVAEMKNELHIQRGEVFTKREKVPSWLETN